MKKIVCLLVLVACIMVIGACSRMNPPTAPIAITAIDSSRVNNGWVDCISSVSGRNPIDDKDYFLGKSTLITELITNNEFAICGDINDQASFNKWWNEKMASLGNDGMYWPKDPPKGREVTFAGRKAIVFPAISVVKYWDGAEKDKAVKEGREPKMFVEKMQGAAFGCTDFRVHAGEILKAEKFSHFFWLDIGKPEYADSITTDLETLNLGDKVEIYYADGRTRQEVLVSVSKDQKSVIIGVNGVDSLAIFNCFTGFSFGEDNRKFVPAKVINWRSNPTDDHIIELRFEIVESDVWERADWRYIYPSKPIQVSIPSPTPTIAVSKSIPKKTETTVWSNDKPDQKIQGVLDKSSLWIAGDQVTVAVRVDSEKAKVARNWKKLNFKLGNETVFGTMGAITDPRDGSDQMILTIKLERKESLKIEGK